MKPTAKLLQPARLGARATPTTTSRLAVPESIFDRKREIGVDLSTLAAAPQKADERVDHLLARIRRDSLERPRAIQGAVVVRVVGTTCNDRTAVPLPNLIATMTAADKATYVGRTDVTGIVVFSAPTGERASYRIVVTAGDGSEVANVEGTGPSVHQLSLGDTKGIEPHAVLGRGWMAAIAQAEKGRDGVKKRAKESINEIEKLTTRKLRSIEARLAIHLEKRNP